MGQWMEGFVKRLEKVRQENLEGGGPERIETQHKMGKLTVRDRIDRLLVVRDMVLMGKKYDGPEALKAGLVDGVFSREELLSKAVEFAKEKVQLNKRAFSHIKQSMPIRLAQVSLIPQDSYVPTRLHAGGKFRALQATGYAPDGECRPYHHGKEPETPTESEGNLTCAGSHSKAPTCVNRIGMKQSMYGTLAEFLQEEDWQEFMKFSFGNR